MSVVVIGAGTLLDDFVFENTPRQLHILNTSSPIASASLVIAAYLVEKLSQQY
jgi:L-2-hydroxyglutarate oxidase LhgO